MQQMINRHGLQVAEPLVRFLEEEALPGTGVEADTFWQGVAEIFARLTPENRRLLAIRDELQAKIDAEPSRSGDAAFLREIGYLADEPAPFAIDPQNVDDEVARIAGPQLVVPVLNARFLLNAANARWGSLYDALYGTDALPGKAQRPGYDAERGAQVIARARAFLDEVLPGWERAVAGGEHPALIARDEGAILFRHHGLHIELVIDPAHPIGRDDPFGIADVVLEAALTSGLTAASSNALSIVESLRCRMDSLDGLRSPRPNSASKPRGAFCCLAPKKSSSRSIPEMSPKRGRALPSKLAAASRPLRAGAVAPTFKGRLMVSSAPEK